MDVKQREAEDIGNVATRLAENNSGHTAQDMLTRLALGRNRLLDVAAHCRSKSEANDRVAHAVNQLRETLAGISTAGNDAIDEILKSDESAGAKAQRVSTVVIEANRQAGNAALATNNAIVEAAQRMFDETGGHVTAGEWLRDHGANLDVPPPRRSLAPGEMANRASTTGTQGPGVGSSPGGGGGGFGVPGGDPGGGLTGTSLLTSTIPSVVGGGGSTGPQSSQSPQSGDGSQVIPSGVLGDPPQDGMDSSGVDQASTPPVPPSTPPSSPSSTPMAGGVLAGPSQMTGPATPATGATPSSAPLPGYGADLRPAGGAASVAPAGPRGLAVPPSSHGSPTTAASGGAATGTAVRRTDGAVARQAPNPSGAAGLRNDQTTAELAGGWIPPGVALPVGATRLIPVQQIDELGPTLVDAAGGATRLPRIVQTVARAVARGSGVAANEIELFRNVVTGTATRVLTAYPQHAPADVADWMLLAAIDALIDGSAELARYHLSWHQAVAPGRPAV